MRRETQSTYAKYSMTLRHVFPSPCDSVMSRRRPAAAPLQSFCRVLHRNVLPPLCHSAAVSLRRFIPSLCPSSVNLRCFPPLSLLRCLFLAISSPLFLPRHLFPAVSSPLSLPRCLFPAVSFRRSVPPPRYPPPCPFPAVLLCRQTLLHAPVMLGRCGYVRINKAG